MMKVLTIHRVYNGKPLDFEIYDDGTIIVADYDIEYDMALAALGDKESPILLDHIRIANNLFKFFSDEGLLGHLFRDGAIVPKLVASTAHMTEFDDETLRERFNRNEASGLYYDLIEYGYIFYLSPVDPPEDVVCKTKNKDGLSDSMVEVMQLAWDIGIYSVQFDPDGRVFEGIEVHDW
jgi:hypothetical protein